MQSSPAIAPMTRPTSERDEIMRHVSKFRAHQEKMAREREAISIEAIDDLSSRISVFNLKATILGQTISGISLPAKGPDALKDKE